MIMVIDNEINAYDRTKTYRNWQIKGINSYEDNAIT